MGRDHLGLRPQVGPVAPHAGGLVAERTEELLQGLDRMTMLGVSNAAAVLALPLVRPAVLLQAIDPRRT